MNEYYSVCIMIYLYYNYNRQCNYYENSKLKTSYKTTSADLSIELT